MRQTKYFNWLKRALHVPNQVLLRQTRHCMCRHRYCADQNGNKMDVRHYLNATSGLMMNITMEWCNANGGSHTLLCPLDPVTRQALPTPIFFDGNWNCTDTPGAVVGSRLRCQPASQTRLPNPPPKPASAPASLGWVRLSGEAACLLVGPACSV